MNDQMQNESPILREGKGISGVLGNPEGYIRKLCEITNLSREMGFLLLLALGGAAIYGFAVGWFVDWQVAFVDAAKAAGIVLFSYLLCLPTLYVFSSIGGCHVSVPRLVVVGLVVLAAIGCILAALAPVLWLFAVSSESVGLFILLIFALIFVAVVLGGRMLIGIVRARVVNRGFGLIAWFFVFIFVSLQMITVIRPMLTVEAKTTLEQTQCKRFFLSHFFYSLQEAVGTSDRSRSR